ncbi:hypothetical protein M430DRAFT_188575 [Amorphotheca resinae ATCC 22711]|uniref:Secreted protein n=1 Tax=Amorphotheca resinae ATCC 22711 TaxID=857342 RepID=A0A2T3AR23_AMORE|nr:hypothetical protein M430DRAFT_188575 [Amorphotheca resinae ATCC 22711]PSS08714.1 hypothetical protein M430DRAFT_188575 [Amorphotheca resinae ATCC 22711]
MIFLRALLGVSLLTASTLRPWQCSIARNRRASALHTVGQGKMEVPPNSGGCSFYSFSHSLQHISCASMNDLSFFSKGFSKGFSRILSPLSLKTGVSE